MATYEIRLHGRTQDMAGFTVVTVETDGAETPLMVYSNERQALEAVAILQREHKARLETLFREKRRGSPKAFRR
jgi:hypothetical protein